MNVNKIVVQYLDNKGEGIGKKDHTTYAIPFTLPGEEVAILEVDPVKENVYRADRYERLTDSPDRQEAPCPYFGVCGGCQLQHLKPDFYKAYKKGLLQQQLEFYEKDALTNYAKDLEVETFSPGIRRRINFKVMKMQKGVALGYYQRRTHRILDIEVCPLLTQKLQDLILPFKQLFATILEPGEKLNLFLTEASNGFDVVMDFEVDKDFHQRHLHHLVEMARLYKICRFSLKTPRGQRLLYEAQKPIVHFEGVPVSIQPNPFLQPSQVSQEAMIQAVTESIPSNCQKIADLFAGVGTFTFPLAKHAQVDAYEENTQAVQALLQNKGSVPHKIQGVVRNLFTHPLTPKELTSYDVVVIDPPRAGALTQIKNLADSNVAHIVMISCNAHTFARDTHLLIKGGYQLQHLKIFDQFLWSVHLEMVAVFVSPTHKRTLRAKTL